MPIPACDTTPWPSAETFTRDADAIFFTCEVPSRGNDLNLRQVRLFLAGQALSLIYTPSPATFHEKSGLTLSAASSDAKFQAGEVVEGLRLAQRAIDVAEGDPAREQVMVGSPLTVAITLRGANRLALGISGWRDDLDSAARMAVSIDTTSHIGAIVLKYCMAIHNGASLPDAQAFVETAEALELAERCGEDFTVDSARLARGVVLANGDIAHRPAGLELLAEYRQASLRHGYATDSVRYADTETAKEKARVGDLDGAIEIGRTVVDFLFNAGDMTSRGLAVTVLVESLLRRGNQPDLAEAVAAIERLATVPIDPGFVLHELPLLRMRALLARVRGDEDGYADFVRRYRAMANELGFEGHMALAATMG
jgi:adenylate cyclase